MVYKQYSTRQLKMVTLNIIFRVVSHLIMSKKPQTMLLAQVAFMYHAMDLSRNRLYLCLLTSSTILQLRPAKFSKTNYTWIAHHIPSPHVRMPCYFFSHMQAQLAQLMFLPTPHMKSYNIDLPLNAPIPMSKQYVEMHPFPQQFQLMSLMDN